MVRTVFVRAKQESLTENLKNSQSTPSRPLQPVRVRPVCLQSGFCSTGNLFQFSYGKLTGSKWRKIDNGMLTAEAARTAAV
jgi:hypothetical protein